LQEKQAKTRILAALQAARLPATADVLTKQAAVVAAFADEGVKAANGYLVSLDDEVYNSVLAGTFKAAADDDSAVLPGAVPSGDVPATDPAASPAPAGADDPEKILQEILAAVQSGEMTIDEMKELLGSMGMAPEDIEAVAAVVQEQSGSAPAAPTTPAADPAAASAPVAAADPAAATV
jgi:hypothetical protein